MATSDNFNQQQLEKSMKSLRTKIDNVETKYGAVDISPNHPLYAKRQALRGQLDTVRSQWAQTLTPIP